MMTNLCHLYHPHYSPPVRITIPTNDSSVSTASQTILRPVQPAKPFFDQYSQPNHSSTSTVSQTIASTSTASRTIASTSTVSRTISSTSISTSSRTADNHGYPPFYYPYSAYLQSTSTWGYPPPDHNSAVNLTLYLPFMI